jgi:hypothetical protein
MRVVPTEVKGRLYDRNRLAHQNRMHAPQDPGSFPGAERLNPSAHLAKLRVA